MEFIKYEVLGHSVIFECSARDTRNGFAHDATIIIDMMRFASATSHYLNRTWEAWRFQNVCKQCVCNMIEYRIDDIKDRYRSERGLSRIVGDKRKQEVEDIIENDDQIILLRGIMAALVERG